MNPCRKYREQIAWLAMDTSEIHSESEVRAHLKTCARCRGYLEEISNVAGNLREAEPAADVQTSLSFHRRVTAALSAAESHSANSLGNLRLAFAVSCTAALVVLACLVAWPHAGAPERAVAGKRSNVNSKQRAELEPTFSNYEDMAHRSLDKLDELLTEQGSRNQQPLPMLTTGGLLSNSAE